MSNSSAVELAIETLLKMGVLNREGLARLGQLFEGVAAIGGMATTTAPAVAPPRPRGRPAGGAARTGAKRRGRRARVDVTKEQMTSLVNQGLSNAQIAKELGCSVPTVYNKKKEFGLVKARGGGKKAGKKKAKKKTGKKKAATKVGKK